MSEVFNFRRFAAYAARTYSLDRKKYLIQAGALLGFMIAALLLVKVSRGEYFSTGDIHNLGEFYFSFVLTVSVLMFVISVMKPFKGRHTIVVENTVPASATEKFLFVLLNTTVVFFALFLFAVFITALFGMSVLGRGTLNDYFYNGHEIYWRFILWLYLPVQAGALYAGTMERRNHIVSFMLVAAAVVAAIAVFMASPIIISGRSDTVIEYGPMFLFSGSAVSLPHARVGYVDSFWDVHQLFVTCLTLAGTLMFWVAAWFNFRERSIK